MNENKKTILLVEDESITSMITAKTLQAFGYEVFIADSGEKAVETAADNTNINLILMDIDLGEGIDGTEAAAIILKGRNIPVVFLSSHIEPEIVEKTEKITSYGYVVKNSGNTVLDASIKMAFKLFEAREQIEESVKKLHAAHKLSHIGVWDWFADTDTVIWTEELYNIAGLDPKSPAPSYADQSRIYSPESWERLKRCVDNAMETAEQYNLDLELIRPDGSRRFVNASGGVKYDRSGQINGLYGTVQDLTELKRVEENLRTHKIELENQNEELLMKQEELESFRKKYFDLYDLAPVGYLTINSKGLISEANLYAATMLGVYRGTLAMQPISGFIFKEDQDKYYMHRKKLFETGELQSFDLRMIRSNGNMFPSYIQFSSGKDENGHAVCRIVMVEKI